MDEGEARASYQNIKNNLNIMHGQPLGISPRDYVKVYVDENDRIVVEKAVGMDQLAGSLYPGYKVKRLAEELDLERKVGER